MKRRGVHNGGEPRRRETRDGSEGYLFSKQFTFRRLYGFPAAPELPPLRPSAVFLALLLSACQSGPAVRKNDALRPDLSPGAATPFKSFAIYTDRLPRRTHYVPSGYMGDSDLTMSGAYTATPHGEGPCLRVNYHATGPKGWAGIYWQDPANNWGEVPGRAGFDLRGATRLTLWARGENGGEKVHEFRMGGIVGQYPDSDVASISNIRLTKEWKQYAIDLSRKDLRHVIAGFGFFLNKAENPGGMTFYLDDIMYEGPGAKPLETENARGGEPEKQPGPSIAGLPIPPLAASSPAVPEPVIHELTAPTLPPTTSLQVKQVESGLRVSFSSQFLFTSGRAVLGPASQKVLDELIALLSAYPKNRVLIEGHTDSTGDPKFNLKLSDLRATSVRDYLIKRGGFDAARFQVMGYGDTRPVADNNSKSGRSLNRRVEVTILKSAS